MINISGDTKVIFDVDRTLIDNDKQIHRAYKEILYSRKINVRPGETFPGATLFDKLALMKLNYGIDDTIEELAAERTGRYLYIIDNFRIYMLPGASLIIHLLKGKGISISYCSSSAKIFTDALFKGTGIDTDIFDVGINWAPGLKKKPSPDLYEIAIQRLNTTPSNCLVFEDDWTGGEAASRAGCNVVFVGSGKQVEYEAKYHGYELYNNFMEVIKNIEIGGARLWKQ